MNRKNFLHKSLAILLLLLGSTQSSMALDKSVVLDNFEVDPYTNINPDTTPTIVSFPTTATPTGWNWVYAGYGTPASGDRNTADAIDVASWRFLMPQAANLDDPALEDTLSGAGPVMYMQFNNGGSELRTLDQIIADLGQPEIDWSQPVYFAMQVKAKWGVTGGVVGSFSTIRQGILVFSYDDGGSVGTVIEATFAPGDNDTWKEVSMELIGQDAGGQFLLGMFGAVDFTPTRQGFGDQSPQLEFFFDDLRVNYTAQRPPSVSVHVPTLPKFSLIILGLLLIGVVWRSFRWT